MILIDLGARRITRRLQARRWRAENRVKVNAYARAWRAENGAKCNATIRDRRLADPEKYREARRRRYWAGEREKVLARGRAARRADPLLTRKYNLRNLYGMSFDDYDALLSAQGEKCAICLGPFDTRPHVDHCHETGKVRGLLCNRCNCGIGQLRDNVEILEAAVKYLMSHSIQTSAP